ncbi:hypothetical protein LNAOJCKE_5189 [Methylorubrum aminovorans]|uniref:Uncharacterized protein n=1 Tax=Methylorubrum aminovorans TaxID=269069 RepID=A0ABQ4UL87_9HYPH|nr:hypothetical protein [Methylorubrum aminovorans]GJE67954.1 hypothetical protein LNAOJCKE_5189 [Methylorubrum aminovorans]GMA76343.1 hypothetical protein GCM10025880_27600 [Methylorubrum aminovorans]
MAQDKDADHVTVKAVRPFDGAEGYKDEASQPFSVHSRRAAELKANGLVEECTPEAAIKAAPAPENKMAVEPANKVTPATAVRRTKD